MKLSSRLRASCLPWAGPLALALTVFYYFGGIQVELDASAEPLADAPNLVSHVTEYMFVLAYAIAACLGVWESGRLKDAGVWQSVPARSRYCIAFDALIPPVLVSWSLFLVPSAMVLVHKSVWPIWGLAPMLGLGMILSAAWAAIGFAAGMRFTRLIAAPVLAAGVFYVIGWSVTYIPYWPRHISGMLPSMMYGERYTLPTLLAHLLPASCLAAGLALLWLPRQGGGRAWRIGARVAAAAVAAAGFAGAYTIVKDWDHSPRLAHGQVSMQCSGTTPRVCMPESSAAERASARHQIRDVFSKLEKAGVPARKPQEIRDTLGDGRFGGQEDHRRGRLRMPLTESQQAGTLRFEALHEAVKFHYPDEETRSPNQATALYSARLWAAKVVGADRAERADQGEALGAYSGRAGKMRRTIDRRVSAVLNESEDAQAAWFRGQMRTGRLRTGRS
ncbi:hypothetical protein [Streptomyces sp. ODS28]|uniref:hypothetical protein n=1 Tax=Streptomyces sp. ODS28 TaxID=3136688 RepID=UPI0031EC987F